MFVAFYCLRDIICLTVNLIYDSMKLFFYTLDAQELCDVTILYFRLSSSPLEMLYVKTEICNMKPHKTNFLKFP